MHGLCSARVFTGGMGQGLWHSGNESEQSAQGMEEWLLQWQYRYMEAHAEAQVFATVRFQAARQCESSVRPCLCLLLLFAVFLGPDVLRAKLGAWSHEPCRVAQPSLTAVGKPNDHGP